MTVNGDHIHDLIQADLDGELSVAERAELARVLLQDPEARRLHDEFRRTDQLLRGVLQVEPPANLRTTVLAGTAMSVRPGASVRRQYGWPPYRVAAAILGGLLIVGISYILREGGAPGTDLQGSMAAGGRQEAIAVRDRWSMRAESVEASASLRREGEGLRLELNLLATIPCEVIAKFDPATTTFVGKSDDANLTAASGQVTVQAATGRQAYVLDFSRAAPIQLQLRSGGRLLGEGKLSVSGP
jgi:anti-sigma factor RsiW